MCISLIVFHFLQLASAWINDEMCDVLLIFKSIQLDPNYKNNYKELSRRMADAGWNRDNNQCRQQVVKVVILAVCRFYVTDSECSDVYFLIQIFTD